MLPMHATLMMLGWVQASSFFFGLGFRVSGPVAWVA